MEVSAEPVLRLLPTPGLVIEFRGAFSGLACIRDIASSVKLLPQGVKLQVIPVSLSFGDGHISGVLVPRRQPCTVPRKTRQRFQSVKFGILNFPKFFGRQDRIHEDGKGGGKRLGGAQLTAGTWDVEITAYPI